MVSDRDHENRPLSLGLAGQSSQRSALAATIQTSLQSRPTEPAEEVLN
jgi:pantothenate kinase-related protein Tda10